MHGVEINIIDDNTNDNSIRMYIESPDNNTMLRNILFSDGNDNYKILIHRERLNPIAYGCNEQSFSIEKGWNNDTSMIDEYMAENYKELKPYIRDIFANEDDFKYYIYLYRSTYVVCCYHEDTETTNKMIDEFISNGYDVRECADEIVIYLRDSNMNILKSYVLIPLANNNGYDITCYDKLPNKYIRMLEEQINNE